MAYPYTVKRDIISDIEAGKTLNDLHSLYDIPKVTISRWCKSVAGQSAQVFRLKRWLNEFTEYFREPGGTITGCCKYLGVSLNTYYYRQARLQEAGLIPDKLKKALDEAYNITEAREPNGDVELICGSVRVSISKDADADTITNIVQALLNCNRQTEKDMSGGIEIANCA